MPRKPKNLSAPKAANQLISLAHAAKISNLSHDHLRRLALTNKLQAVKMGRDWFTTETAVRAYLATNRSPGPKPKKN